jgi:Ku C terminal domain like
VEEAVCGIYNTFLVEVVKEIYSSMPRYKSFWEMVVAKGVSLISSAEVEESDVSSDTAASFLLEEVVEVAVEVVKPVEVEEDDMFGEME